MTTMRDHRRRTRAGRPPWRPLALALAAFGLAAAPAAARHPEPADAGFHHCALIYDRATRGPDDLAHYAARTGPGRSEWLFDAFLFLIQRSARNIRTENEGTQMEDWQYHLDRWFAPGRDLHALDTALERAAEKLGPPPAKRRVMLSIPYTHPDVTDFGDVDGDGSSEDLSTPAGREAVIGWYIDAARARFRSAGYRHLELWGFYWMAEGIRPEDEASVRTAGDLVRARGHRLLWIPYYRSEGWNRWKEAGIDVAILQPNYAFTNARHGGRSGRNRLAVTADLAHSKGMGVEIEAYNVVTDAADRRVFLRYLADGHTLGYQRAATAYYLGTDVVERTATSPNPEVRAMYDALADYVTGRTVPDPDARLKWTWGEADGGLSATTTLPSSGRVSAVEVSLKEPDAGWLGTIEVAVRAPGASDWTPAGWTLRTGTNPLDGATQMERVPVEQDAEALRVTFRADVGSPPLRVTRILTDHHGPTLVRHAAMLRPYRIIPETGGQYPDSGSELTDGRIPDDGFASGGTVGWRGGRNVAVSFDLGAVLPVDRIEVFAQGGGGSAVNWPSRSVALLSSGAVPPAWTSGYGPLPDGFTSWRGGPVTETRRRGENDRDGRIDFSASGPARARFVTLVLEPNGWLMLSEVRIVSEGRNIAPDATYTLRPRPSGAAEAPYTDDGARLTDGVVAQGFAANNLTGWKDGRPREVEVDLGGIQPVRRVTVWSLRGGQNGIFAPKEVTVESSRDGRAWTSLGPVSGPTGPEDGTACVAAPYRVEAPEGTTARFIRVRASGSTEWLMLSEIEVSDEC